MSRWVKTEVRNTLRDAINPVVAPLGFRYRARDPAFVRKTEEGRQELTIAIRDYNPVFEFSFSLCSRIDAVQAIMNRFTGSPPRYHDMTLTSITQLEFLGLHARPGKGVIYSVKSAEELAATISDIIAVIKDRVLPFFNEYRRVEDINRGLNPVGAEHVRELIWPPDRGQFDATNQPYRSMAGVAVAHFASDPRIQELIAAYRSQIREFPDDQRKKLDDLDASLEL